MNIELEVIRINEDVIATSSKCQYNSTAYEHWVFGETLNEGNDINCVSYQFDEGEWKNEEHSYSRSVWETESGYLPNPGDVFHTDEDGHYYKCDENHNYISSLIFDCLAKGTKIAMANRTLKNIEDIVEGDAVLTYNHEKGTYEGQKVYLTWKSKEAKYPFTLHFTNDVNISVVGEHNFFEKESLTYVAIFENKANEFIGKHFYNAISNRYEELLSVTFEKEAVDYYEIYTEYNANCIANSMLNVPHDSVEILNIYKFNEDLSIDHKQLEKDIDKYGLYEYPKDASYPKELFNILKWKYVNIIIGKGFGTWDDYIERRDVYLSSK